jgi:hypothetical protein
MPAREWLARKRLDFYLGALAAGILMGDRDLERRARREIRAIRRRLRRASSHAA